MKARCRTSSPKRFRIEEVWTEELIAKKPEYRGKTLFDVLFRNGQVDKFPLSDIEAGYLNDESKAFGFYVHKGLFEDIGAPTPRAETRRAPVQVMEGNYERMVGTCPWWDAIRGKTR